MNSISSHVLNTSLGRPAAGVHVRLEQQVTEDQWNLVWQGVTDSDGRVPRIEVQAGDTDKGVFRITFETGEYFSSLKQDCFYPYAAIVFQIHDPAQHYHVPLLLNPFGYSTYRGS
jgi:5-hydroxyisourate hydrolase